MTIFNRLLSFLITLLTPVFLLGLALRLLLTPFFLQVEYRMPGFPADPYGFTFEDRLRWAPYALDYLTNPSDISFLADLRFEDGRPLFNDRELSHMDDVKRVTLGALRVFYIACGLLALSGLWAWLGEWGPSYRLGWRRGGWLMVVLAGAVASIVLVGMFLVPDVFWDFFTFFHSLFFEGDSWLFAYSDTLIRLFPLRFWQDAFLFAAGLAVAGGLVLGLGLRPSKRTVSSV